MSPPAIAIALLTRANAYERGDLTDTSPELLREASAAISSLLARLAEARDQRDALAEALRALHDDCVEYSRINNLGGEDNQVLVRARAALVLLEEGK